MGNRTVLWVAIGLLLVATMIGVGYYAYSAGVAQGIAHKAHTRPRAEWLP
jgi:hypothetical protein